MGGLRQRPGRFSGGGGFEGVVAFSEEGFGSGEAGSDDAEVGFD